MSDIEVEVRKQPRNPLVDRTPNLGDAMQQKYVDQNFQDRKEIVLSVELKTIAVRVPAYKPILEANGRPKLDNNGLPMFTIATDRDGIAIFKTELRENPLVTLLKAHAIATQGGLWRKHPEKEAAFFRWVTRILVTQRNASNPFHPFIMDMITYVHVQFFARYNLSLEEKHTGPGPVVATAPVGFAPYPFQTQVSGMGLPQDQMSQPLPPQPQPQAQQPQQPQQQAEKLS